MHEPGKAAGWREAGLLLLLGLLWGMPYALTKIALTTIPPVTLAAGRISLAALVLWIIVCLRANRMPVWRDWVGRLLLQGCVACAIPYTLIAFGQQTVDSALAAILNSTAPFFVCVISLAWVRHEPVTAERLFGVTAGLGGVVMITGASALAGLGQAMVGQSAIVLATLSSAISAIHGRRLADLAPEVAAAGTLTSAAAVLVPLSFMVEAPLDCSPSVASLAALTANAVVATALGFVVYFRLIRSIGSMGTASCGYLKPAFGVLIGCTLMGESLTWAIGIGLFAIVIGVAAINRAASMRASGPIGANIRPASG